MNWEAIGALGEIFGALAVLVTLIYLSTQVKLTNKISRFDTSKNLMEKFDDLNGRVVGDVLLRNALMKDEPLSADEEEQVYTFTNMYCNTWSICQIAYDNDLIDERLYDGFKRDVPFEMERWPNFRTFVKRWLDSYPTMKDHDIFGQAV